MFKQGPHQPDWGEVTVVDINEITTLTQAIGGYGSEASQELTFLIPALHRFSLTFTPSEEAKKYLISDCMMPKSPFIQTLTVR